MIIDAFVVFHVYIKEMYGSRSKIITEYYFFTVSLFEPPHHVVVIHGLQRYCHTNLIGGFYSIEDVECGWVWKSCSSQIFGCNFIFQRRALGAWCIISWFHSPCLMFHLGNPVKDVNDIWCGMSTLKVVGLVLFWTQLYESLTFKSGLFSTVYMYIHPRSYVVCGSEKGDVVLYNLGKHRFSNKRSVNLGGGGVPENLL
jgi:hypothetical protein